MENNNTVTLSLNEYNNLRDFKTHIDSGKHICFQRTNLIRDYYYFNDNVSKEIEEIKDYYETIIEENKSNYRHLENKFNKLEIDNETLSIERNNIEKELNNTISNIKQMSIWEFLKYRKR